MKIKQCGIAVICGFMMMANTYRTSGAGATQLATAACAVFCKQKQAQIDSLNKTIVEKDETISQLKAQATQCAQLKTQCAQLQTAYDQLNVKHTTLEKEFNICKSESLKKEKECTDKIRTMVQQATADCEQQKQTISQKEQVNCARDKDGLQQAILALQKNIAELQNKSG